MYKQVSIIIPCYNAERWIAEAIDSCLQQSYPAVEIIVIDDGSTDKSLDIIKSYGDRLIWRTGENKGGNHARNRGFALSQGEYIQFLDADDYILPKKIARQIDFLEQNNADVVYGDWRHQQHLPSGKTFLEEVKISGEQEDILESLLADWWVSPACILFNRKTVINSGGWDECLKAGQDRDFLISVVVNGASVVYQPGCYSVYRRYGNVTVSSSSKTRYIENQLIINRKVENNLDRLGKLSKKNKEALAQSYFLLARAYIKIAPDKYQELLNKVFSLYPDFKAHSDNRTVIYILAQNIFGFKMLEKLVFLSKYSQNLLKKKLLYFIP